MKAVRYFLIFIAAALAAVLIADMTFLGTATAFIRDGRMAYGMKAGSVSIGGMTREEAAREIQRIAKTALNGEALILSLPDENHAFSFSAEEIGLSVDTDKMLDAAFSVGRDGSKAQQVFSMLECAFQGKDTPLFAALDNAKLDQALQRVKQAVDRAPKDASIVFLPTGIERQPGLTGRRLDTNALAAKVTPRLLELRLPAFPTAPRTISRTRDAATTSRLPRRRWTTASSAPATSFPSSRR